MVGNKRNCFFALCLFGFTTLCFNSFSQLSEKKQQKLDSILNEIAKGPSDSALAHYYNGLAGVYFKSDFDICDRYLDTAMLFADKSGNLHALAWSIRIRGDVKSYTSEEDPLKYYLSSLEISESIKNDFETFTTCNSLGIYYKQRSIYDTAILYYEKGYSIAERVGNYRAMARFIGNSANIKKRIGDYDGAVAGYLRAIHLADSIGSENSVGINLMNLGNIYTLNGNKTDAVDAFLKSKEIAIRNDNYLLLAYVLNNLGSVYVGLKDYEQAFETLSSSLEAANKIKNKRMISANNRDLGNMLFQQYKFEEALPYFQKAYDIALETKEESRIADASTFLAKCHLWLGDHNQSLKLYQSSLEIYQRIGEKEAIPSVLIGLSTALNKSGKFRDALPIATEGTKIAKEMGKIGLISDGYNQQYISRDAIGDFKNALDNHVQFKLYSDSMVNVDLLKQITTLENDFKFEQEREEQKRIQNANEAELNAQILAQKNLRNIFILGTGILIVIAFFIYRSYRVKQRANAILNAKNEEISNLSRFREAMTGMIAHDLKNPLGIILGTETEKPSTRQMARQMLGLVNNMLDVHKFETTEVVLDMTNVQFNQLIAEATEQVRPLLSEKNIDIKFELQELVEVNIDHEYMLRVFVNLFTNAIKYSPNNSTISVNAEVIGSKLQISVSDQGEGIATEDQQRIFENFGQVNPKKSGGVGSTGLGLSFCQLALRAHGSDINVDSKVGEGTSFIFSLEISGSKSEHLESRETGIFRMTDSERDMVINMIPELRAMKLHQAFAIEELLESIESSSQQVSEWTEKVISAAYANNEEHYNELLDMVDQKS
ncbi:MAG: tetratricopeptide repeat-containing sensor histidine kinase [bacterium]|nr:tetratricopeptide repeat-containing sensor histidine kinase [bacterium]